MSVLLISIYLPTSLIAGRKINFHFLKGVPLMVTSERTLVYSFFEDNLYYTTLSPNMRKKQGKDSAGFERILYVRNMNSSTDDSLKLNFPPDTQTLKYSLHNISVNNEYIALTFDKIYIFSRTQLTLEHVIPSYNNTGIELLGNGMIFIYKNYSNHPHDDSIDNKIVVYDILHDKETKYYRPASTYAGYTHLVNNFADVKEGQFALASPMPYDISIYSTSSCKLENRITGEKFNNSRRLMKIIDSVNKQMRRGQSMKELIYALRREDSAIRIEKVSFLNRNTLLVSKTVPNGRWERRSLDVWKKDRNKWTRTVSGQLYETEKKYDYTISDTTLPIDLTFSDKLVTDRGIIYVINTKVPPRMGITKAEYQKEMDIFYETNPPKYYLWLYTWEVK